MFYESQVLISSTDFRVLRSGGSSSAGLAKKKNPRHSVAFSILNSLTKSTIAAGLLQYPTNPIAVIESQIFWTAQATAAVSSHSGICVAGLRLMQMAMTAED